MRQLSRFRLLDYRGRLHKYRLRKYDAERFGGFHVDDKVEGAGHFHWQIGGLCALEDLVHVLSRKIDNGLSL